MRTWWSRLTGSPKAMAATGAGVVAVVALVVVGVLAATGGSSEDDTAEAAATASATPSAETLEPGEEPEPGEEAPEELPPDRDEYCPAFAKIQSGGLTTPRDEESDTVDLAELGRVFDTLIQRYGTAERVAPLELRDSYAQTLGYLRQGKRAVASEDVELLQALAVNLSSLNDSMEEIQTGSAAFCD